MTEHDFTITRKLLCNRFVISSKIGLMKPPSCFYEAKTRVIVSEIIRDHTQVLHAMVNTVRDTETFVINDVIRMLIHELFRKFVSWDRIVCLYAVVEVLAKNELLKVCDENMYKYSLHYHHKGITKSLDILLDESTRVWIHPHNSWLSFLNKFSMYGKRNTHGSLLKYLNKKLQRYSYEQDFRRNSQ